MVRFVTYSLVNGMVRNEKKIDNMCLKECMGARRARETKREKGVEGEGEGEKKGK